MKVAPTRRGWQVERTIQAPPDAVWEVLTDLTAWPRWGPTVAHAELDGVAFVAGARGTVRTVGGITLPFVVDDLVAGRRWSWRVAGVPATSHWVEPEGEGCRAGMTAPLWAPAYLPVLTVALARIDGMVGR